MKKEKFKKKFVYRLGMEETNSSSSHSCCIVTDRTFEARPGDPEYNLNIKNNILYIPEPDVDFGSDRQKFNTCLEKLWYVCGFYATSYTGYGQKRLRRLETILKKVFNVSEVKFEWVDRFLTNYPSSESEEDYIEMCEEAESLSYSPTIDHQSYSSMRKEVCESVESIRSFILNKNSWLYTDSDCSTSYEFYGETLKEKEADILLKINFGGNLGIVDILVSEMDRLFTPQPPFRKVSFLEDLIYDRETNMFYVSPSLHLGVRVAPGCEKRNDPKESNPENYYAMCSGEAIIKNIEGKYYIKFSQISANVQSVRSQEDFIQLMNIIEKNYVLFPVEIISKEFGKLV